MNLIFSYIHRNLQKHGFIDNFRTYLYYFHQSIGQQKHSRIQTQQALN